MSTTLSSTLTLLHVSSNDAGLYFCEVHNEFGEFSTVVESIRASITVHATSKLCRYCAL